MSLSSAEAELVAMNKAAAELLGIIAMLVDLGEGSIRSRQPDSVSGCPVRPDATGMLTGVVCGDSSAAIAVAQRRGCGKLRHIHIGQLWIQERIQEKELAVAEFLYTKRSSFNPLIPRAFHPVIC